MDEMTAFDQQIAREVVREAGPSEPVDGAAIFTAITAAQSPKWRSQSMFSATKFVVAGAILALFGGFLLAGVLTQPSEEQMPAVGASASPEVNPTVVPTSAPQASDGAGTFSPAGSLPEPRFGHTATLLRDGRVLVIGGEHPTDDPQGLGIATVAGAMVWDPGTASFSHAGSLAEARSGHTATLLRDGRVLVVGGYDYDDCEGYCFHNIEGAEVWDPETATFSPAGSLDTAREAHAAILVPDGRVLIVGGFNDEGSGHLRTAEVWDPGTETFSPAGSLDLARILPDATLLPDGRVLIAGARGESFRPRLSAEIWDPRTLSSVPVGSFAHTHDGHRLAGFSTTRLDDGDILLVGGEYDLDPTGDNDFHYVATALVWDPESGESRAVGRLAQERAFHTATRLHDGRVLVFGGGSSPDHGELASAELWDPATGSFTTAGALDERREGHSMTLLDDGRILVVGGMGDEEALASAEVWAPGAQQSAEQDIAETTAATPDLLPGVDLVTEEIEPGVYQVVSDGAVGPVVRLAVAGTE